jgi:PAS domain S-box-containing protein
MTEEDYKLNLDQNNLQVLNTRLSLALSSKDIGVWELNLETGETVWDDRMFEIYGIDKLSLVSYDVWFNAVFPEDRDAAVNSFEWVIINKKKKREDFRIIMPDGRIKHIESSCDALCDNLGKVIRIIGVNIDVTETKENEKKLKIQNEKLTTLKTQLDNSISIANLGIWEWDTINNTRIWSDITYEIYGVAKNTTLNLELIESLILEEDLELHRRRIAKCLESKKSFSFEYRIRKNNKIITIQVICNAIVENDKVVKLTGIVQDITKTREREHDLLYAQKIAEVGHYDFNIEKNTFSSSEMLDTIWGIPEDYIKTFETWLELVFKDDREMMQNYFTTIVKNNINFDKEYRIINQNTKEIKWVHGLGVIIFDKNNTPLRMFGTVQDITKIKLLEIDKEYKDKLLYQQSKMAAMGEMIGNIAHQWRQPLSTISTASTGAKLQKEMDLLTDYQLYKLLTSINDSAQYLSQTIEDFRSFFNPNNNKINEFNISDTLSKTLKLISAQFTTKDIEIIENIEPYNLVSIENEIIQVLINILNNARDALLIKEKQRKLLFINTYKKDKSLCIEILDNAGGIDIDIIDRIFEPYFTTKHESQGTGIGLYISYDIIKNHLNGSLIVSNEKYHYEDIDCEGAKFIIEISS